MKKQQHVHNNSNESRQIHRIKNALHMSMNICRIQRSEKCEREIKTQIYTHTPRSNVLAP